MYLSAASPKQPIWVTGIAATVTFFLGWLWVWQSSGAHSAQQLTKQFPLCPKKT
jgi:hypothetical protein